MSGSNGSARLAASEWLAVGLIVLAVMAAWCAGYGYGFALGYERATCQLVLSGWDR